MSGGVPAGELLPCPFCGGSAQCKTVAIRDGAALSCRNPECMGGVGAFHPDAHNKCFARWNTRATPTPPIEGRDADVERDVRMVIEAAKRGAGVVEVKAAR